MARNITETFIKGSDNFITLTLTEGDNPVFGSWDSLTIYIGDPAKVVITRSVDGDGIAFSPSTGTLTIRPSELIEDLTDLVNGWLYRAHITVTSAGNPGGVDFGADDSSARLNFLIDERPEAST